MVQAKFAFIKLIVGDLAGEQRFYEQAFGFTERGRFETAAFDEVILGQDGVDVTLMLLCYTDGRPLPDARAHGPTGFATDDIEAAHAACVAAGATAKGPVLVVEGGVKVALLDDPEGHEIELCQFG